MTSPGISGGPDFVSISLPGCPRSKKPGIFTPEPRKAKIHDFGDMSQRWPPGRSGAITSPGHVRRTNRPDFVPKSLPECPRVSKSGISAPEPHKGEVHNFGTLSLWRPLAGSTEMTSRADRPAGFRPDIPRGTSPRVLARRNRPISRRNHIMPKSVILAYLHDGCLQAGLGW
jgi:hypothetical protein